MFKFKCGYKLQDNKQIGNETIVKEQSIKQCTWNNLIGVILIIFKYASSLTIRCSHTPIKMFELLVLCM